MTIEQIATLLIYSHASLGGLALLAGVVALSAKKGLKLHKRSGKIFYYSMLYSAIVALVVSLMPGHYSPFLFGIGMFSSYFIISGYRSLRFRRVDANLSTDRVIAYSIILTGLAMILYPIFIGKGINIILLVFGLVAIGFGVSDLIAFNNREKLRKQWQQAHLSKMIGGYIAAFTAFLVVNQVLPPLWSWFAPSVVGTVFIIYWLRKLNRQ